MLPHNFCEGGWLCFLKKSLLGCKLCCLQSVKALEREKEGSDARLFQFLQWNIHPTNAMQWNFYPMQCNGTSPSNLCNSMKPGSDSSCLQLCLFLSTCLLQHTLPPENLNPILNWISSLQRLLNDNPWRWDIFTAAAGEALSLEASGKLKLIPTSRLCHTAPARSLSGSPPSSHIAKAGCNSSFSLLAPPWQLLLIFASSFGRLGGGLSSASSIRVQSFSMRKPGGRRLI